MSRSNKEARLNHSGYTVETGHGGLKRNMSVGQRIKPAGENVGSGRKRADARKAKAKPAGGAAAKPADSNIEQGSSGWDKIGQAGADIVSTYNKRKGEVKGGRNA